MAKELINIVDNNNIPFAFADQVIMASDYSPCELFLSAYCYDSAVGRLKPTVTPRPDNDPSFNITIYKDKQSYSFTNNFIRKQLHTSVTHIPDTEMVKLVNYLPKKEEGYSPFKGCDSRQYVVFFKLPELIQFYKETSCKTVEEIESDIATRKTKLKNTLLDYEGLHTELFKLIKNNTNIPFLAEWLPYVLNSSNGIDIRLPIAFYADIESEDNLYAVIVAISEDRIIRSVREGLANGQIAINDSHVTSGRTSQIKGLTEYLAEYNNQLIEKAGSKFSACFDPEKDKFTDKEKDFFEYAEYFGKMQLYEAQKNVVVAISRSLDKNKSAFVCGEMGVGKTALAVSSIYCNSKAKNLNALVMAPGHLVYKWQREIERLFPDAKTVVINDFSDVLAIEKEVKNKKRTCPLFLIISKDSAKISFQERPSVIWDRRNCQFICSSCGGSVKLLSNGMGKKYIEESYKYGLSYNHSQQVARIPVQEAVKVFLSKSGYNSKCSVLKPNGFIDYSCKSPLWTSTSSKENASFYSSRWIKHTSCGWLNMDMAEDYKAWFESLEEDNKEKKDKLNRKIYKAFIDIEENGVPLMAAPRRYSIAKYIRERFKGKLDYFIADEVHLYSSASSAQANAFGDFLSAAKKTIVLTGTLLNGYANGIYYILYRMFSREFVNNGYPYNSTDKFVKQYGVKRDLIAYEMVGGKRYKKVTSKVLPGVSPKLFTDFLLDKAVFVSLADMSTGLPEYSEYPVAVDLEPATRENYNKAVDSVNLLLKQSSVNSRDIAFMAAQKLSVYPDMPYNIPPLYDRTGRVVMKFTDSVEARDTFISNKDRKTLSIVKEKLAKGENVLIYVSYVNTTDAAERLMRIFEAEEIKAFTLDAKSKAQEREKLIDTKVKAGYRVMICNPALVETGLDLLAFTNIIFYQTGYNLFTMRQAARRSYRLNQPNNVNVYFLYYEDTAQEVILSLMADKLNAAMAIEGKFTEEGLNAMSNNDDLLNQIADSLVKNIEHKVKTGDFKKGVGRPEDDDGSRFKLVEMINDCVMNDPYNLFKEFKRVKSINLKALCA